MQLPLSAASQRKILWDNFSRLYDIKAPQVKSADAKCARSAGPCTAESAAMPYFSFPASRADIAAADRERTPTMKIVDADGHVAEGASLAVQAMERWPQFIKTRTDGRPSLKIEGRHYPEDQGPGAGCPPEHGLSTVKGINWSSAEGVLQDADRDHIDTMVLYPSFGLCAPSLEDPEFAAGFARLYNEWIAGCCAPPTAGSTASPSCRSSTAVSRSTSCARRRRSGWSRR